MQCGLSCEPKKTAAVFLKALFYLMRNCTKEIGLPKFPRNLLATKFHTTGVLETKIFAIILLGVEVEHLPLHSQAQKQGKAGIPGKLIRKTGQINSSCLTLIWGVITNHPNDMITTHHPSNNPSNNPR
jgi:hypothetical protein